MTVRVNELADSDPGLLQHLKCAPIGKQTYHKEEQGAAALQRENRLP